MIQLSVMAMILGVVILVALPPARTRAIHNSTRGLGALILAAGTIGCVWTATGAA